MLTLEEAYDVLRLLVTVAQESGPLWRAADRLVKAIAVRIPSGNCRRWAGRARALRAGAKPMMGSWTSGWQWVQALHPHSAPDPERAQALHL
ncbi:DUF6417 family protein [Streptomyces sp. NPDC018947]|uniref:DUF6417 family protein n=1 Tax=Streptomyces sp. NPDC018947 TaxID=3365054 RepID=UPI0037A0A00F